MPKCSRCGRPTKATAVARARPRHRRAVTIVLGLAAAVLLAPLTLAAAPMDGGGPPGGGSAGNSAAGDGPPSNAPGNDPPAGPSRPGGPGAPLFVEWDLGATTAPPAFTPAPFLSDQNADEVAEFFGTLANNQPRVVKVVADLAPGGPAARVLDEHRIDWVFADYETPDRLERTEALVDLVRSSGRSRRAKIGNYNFIAGDAGVDMTNTALYPGAPPLHEAASGAPNLRSALFAGPLDRFKTFDDAAGSSPHLPYVTRFNNWGNQALNTTAELPDYVYQFDARAEAANPAHVGQLLSRADYQVLVQTYRLLGAEGLHVFQPSVYDQLDGELVQYTRQMIRDDTRAGWTLLENHVRFTGNTTVTNTVESALGLVHTAVANNNELHLLVSNLGDDALEDVDFGTIDGRRVGRAAGNALEVLFELDQGHHLWQFQRRRVGGQWVWDFVGEIGLFDDPALLNRHGIGVPEPASAAVLLLGAAALLMRRDRLHTGRHHRLPH